MPEPLTRAKELREKRANLVEQEREILDRAREDDNRPLTDEERQTLDRIDEDYKAITQDIERIERADERERELNAGRGPRTLEDAEGDRTSGGEEDRDHQPTIGEAFRAWALYPESQDPEHLRTIRAYGASPGEMPIRLLDNNERRQYMEHRAQSLTDAEGGYTVPQGFRAVLEDAMLAFGGVRQSRATVLRTATGNQMEIPTLNDTGNTGALLAENTADSEQDMTFGQALLDAYKYTSNIIRVSKELLQDSAFDFDSLVGSKLAERLARITAQHFTTGTGTGQPEGIVTGATLGTTTDTGDTTTFDYADILALFHSVDPAYRAQAEWMGPDASLQIMRTLQDPASQYIWQENARVGAPATLLNRPIVVNQEVADPAASAKCVLFGDMSKFYIRDVLDVSLMRSDQRYMEYHQVAFVAISRHDSVLVDAGTNPIKYLQNAAT